MNSSTKQPATSRAAVRRTEHISIEADPDFVTPAKQPHRITRFSYTVASRFRGCITEIAILEGQYVNVRCIRPNRQPCRYQLDLRFADPKPVLVRRIAWKWLLVCVALGLSGAAALALPPEGVLSSSPATLAGASALCAAVGAFWLFVRRTTESLEFRSVHGQATLVSVVGGIGSARAGKRFFVELIRSINAAKHERAQQKQQFLRDEMREHYRLRELGVLSEEQYEQSKARILAEH